MTPMAPLTPEELAPHVKLLDDEYARWEVQTVGTVLWTFGYQTGLQWHTAGPYYASGDHAIMSQANEIRRERRRKAVMDERHTDMTTRINEAREI
jgi:hypothetical protein